MTELPEITESMSHAEMVDWFDAAEKLNNTEMMRAAAVEYVEKAKRLFDESRGK